MVAREDLVVRVPKAIYAEMVAHVVAGYPDEACGALLSFLTSTIPNHPMPGCSIFTTMIRWLKGR
jgi:proteasome lid subunit RPN8/RPN11